MACPTTVKPQEPVTLLVLMREEISHNIILHYSFGTNGSNNDVLKIMKKVVWLSVSYLIFI